MLDLLVYCQMYCRLFASMRYPEHVAAVVEAAGRLQARCASLVAGAVGGRKTVTCPFDYWVEQGLARSLDRLDAYVCSMA